MTLLRGLTILKTLSLSDVWISGSLHGERVSDEEIDWGKEYVFQGVL
jgi:hypothetical protein